MSSRDNPFEEMFEEMVRQMNEMMEELSDLDDIEDLQGQGFHFTDMSDEDADFSNFSGFGGFGNFGNFDEADFGEGFGGFGSAQPGAGTGARAGRGGAHVDVLDEGDVVRVVADMPGVDKDDITVSVSSDRLKIQASNGDRSYDERVGLAPEIEEGSAEATYNNGVLEVTFEKDEDDDTEIEIE